MTKQPQISEAELALQEWGVEYTKQDDGTIIVDGDIDIDGRKLTKLPDLTKIIVKGSFYCYDNHLTSLAGAPASVGWNFFCSKNQLTSLADAPASVSGNFDCCDNQLTSLAGAPASVSGAFYCDNNHLTSLSGAPAAIGGIFDCQGNQLTSLECAPQKFELLKSDFGNFFSWDEVPEHLRVSPETKEKQKQARLEMQRKIADAGEKKQVFKPAPSIRFKARPR